MWKRVEGDAECDPEYQYGEDGHWAVQDCTAYGGGYQVIEYHISDDDFAMTSWGNHRTLQAAKAEVEERA